MKTQRKKLTPWQRIMRAARRRTGLYLSPNEIQDLHMDDAIATRATLDDDAVDDAMDAASPAAQRLGESEEL